MFVGCHSLVQYKPKLVEVNDSKKYFQDAMRSIGLSTYESHGNFFHVKFNKYSDDIHQALSSKVYYRMDFNVPCLTVRDNTERPVTVTNGTNKLIGTDYSNIVKEVKSIDYNMTSNIKLWDGNSAERIARVLGKILDD